MTYIQYFFIGIAIVLQAILIIRLFFLYKVVKELARLRELQTDKMQQIAVHFENRMEAVEKNNTRLNYRITQLEIKNQSGL